MVDATDTAPPSAVVVEFDWQPGEHADAVQHLAARTFKTGSWRLTKWAAGIGVSVLVLAALLDFAVDRDPATLVALAPWIILVAFWIWVFRRGASLAQTRNAARHQPDFHYPIRHSFDDEGMHIALQNSSMALRWDGMTDVRETDDFLFFHWTPKAAYWTPKRALSDAQLNHLRSLVMARAGTAARLLEG